MSGASLGVSTSILNGDGGTIVDSGSTRACAARDRHDGHAGRHSVVPCILRARVLGLRRFVCAFCMGAGCAHVSRVGAVLSIQSEVLAAFKTLLVASCSVPDGFLVGMCDPGRTLFEDRCYFMTATQLSQFPDFVIRLGRAGVDAVDLVVPSTCVRGCMRFDLASFDILFVCA